MAKRTAAKRTSIKPKGDKRYVRRDRSGKFKESDDVSRSLAQDGKQSARTRQSAGTETEAIESGNGAEPRRELAAHLRQHYGISATLERIPTGQAENYLVRRGDEQWLFKIFQPKYDAHRIEQVADFVRFVVGAGYPAREFVETLGGDRVSMLDDRASVLVPWIVGDTPAANSVTAERVLVQLGRLCGLIHRLGALYEPRVVLSFAGSSATIDERRLRLQRLAAESRDSLEIAAELSVRIAVLERWGDAFSAAARAVVPGLIHGDYHASHVVFEGTVAVGVIDVFGELYVPEWELMRGFFQSVPVDFAAPPDTLAPLWRSYVSGYRSEVAVTPEAVRLGFDYYLLQLTASTYGLAPPLDNSLREFGRWRSRLASFLSTHRTRLRELVGAAVHEHRHFAPTSTPVDAGSCRTTTGAGRRRRSRHSQ